MASAGHSDEAIEQRAAEWVVRLDGAPLTAGETAALREWLTRDPEHQAAFEEASSTWRQLGALRDDSGPLGQLRPRRRPALSRRTAVIGAALAGLLLAASIARYQLGDPWLLLIADYRTAPGELRSVRLSDGSVVELGPSSAIALDFSARERRVRLLAGEAYFIVTPRIGGELRPFVAEASGGTTTALGTEFSIARETAGAQVLAVEHQIEVALAEGGAAVVLSPGQEVSYAAGRGIGRVQPRDIAAATAWRRGIVVFNDTSLGQVVDTLNRYRRDRIVILDPALAQRRVSGVFQTNDLADAIETITGELGIRSRTIYPLVTVLY